MKALINPLQENLVVQVESNEKIFEVASPLNWIDCPDNIVAYQYQYIENQFVPYTNPISEPVVVVEPTKNELLAELELLTAKIQALGN